MNFNHRWSSLLGSLRLSTFLTLSLLISSCGGGGGGGGGDEEEAAKSTVSGFYTKGPVTGAVCHLFDTSHNHIAGPSISEEGVITFNDVTYSGDVYTQCSGGAYLDEATGTTIELSNSSSMRSVTTAIAPSTSETTFTQAVTPLTELVFREAQKSGDIGSQNSQVKAQKVADMFGLGSINIPVIFENA